MKVKKPLTTAKRARELLQYDPDTGIFIWRQHPNPKRGGVIRVGDPAGTADRYGHIIITIDGRHYRAHRLAFLFIEGEWPQGHVDHRNYNPSDNRWSNLRCASQAQNMQNRPAQKNNTSGYKGVSLHRKTGKWAAEVQANGVRRRLGLFPSPEEAHAAYTKAAREMHGDFVRVA